MSGRVACGRLFKRRQTWFLEVAVPPLARYAVGKTKLVRTLGTRDKNEAQRRRASLFAKLRQQIRDAQRGAAPVTIMQEAIADRSTLADAAERGTVVEVASGDVVDGSEVEHEVTEADWLRGAFADRAEAIEHKHGPKIAKKYFDVATGAPGATLVRPLFDKWVEEIKGSVREQTCDMHRQAMGEMLAHFGGEGATIEEITRKAAGAFVSDVLPNGTRWHQRGDGAKDKKRSPATMRRMLSTYSTFWRWLGAKGHTESNPWEKQAMPKAKGRATKRAFTSAELVKLLKGTPTHPALPDLIRLAMFTGARLGDLAGLTAGDCKGGWLSVREGKTAAATRRIPMHKALKPIVTKRTKGKNEDDSLFPECPPQGKDKRRGKGLSQPFTRYRRSLEIPDGADYHSFRRTFIACLKNSLVPVAVVQHLVGHKTDTLAFDGYAPGFNNEKALREAIERVDYGKEAMRAV